MEFEKEMKRKLNVMIAFEYKDFSVFFSFAKLIEKFHAFIPRSRFVPKK